MAHGYCPPFAWDQELDSFASDTDEAAAGNQGDDSFMTLAGRQLEVTYHIQKAGCGPTKITLNGTELSFTRGSNPYRTGAAEIPMSAVHPRLTEGVNRLTVWIG